jgi:dUTPase
MLVLYLVPDDPATKEMYAAAVAAYMAKPRGERDAGFDLFSVAATVPGMSPTAAGGSSSGGAAVKVSQTCRAAIYDPMVGRFRAYWMLPRSSISKTPLRLANSVGLIDAGYRGTLLAMLYSTGADFTVAFGERYFQIAGPELQPFERIEIVDEIPGGATLRGEGGFGSTGRSGAAIVAAAAAANTEINGGVDYIR